MQAERGAATVADQVKPKFARYPPFYRFVYFPFWHIHLPHNDLEMPDQRFHLGVHIFLFGKIIFRHIGVEHFCFFAFEFLYLPVSLLNDAEALPHFLVTH